MTTVRSFAAALLFAVAVGCASMNLAAPKSFDEQLAEAYGTHTAVQSGAAQALRTGAITPADAKAVAAFADQSRVFLDLARTAENAGDLATASGKLTLANGVLTQVQAYLNSRGSPK